MNKSESVFIAPGAVVRGDVSIGENVGIWYNSTVRGDREPITIGCNSNIQDNCVLHTGTGYPISIGKNVSVGHGAIIHGCTIGDNTTIGMGAIVMNGAVIGQNCIIGAGSLVTEHTVISDNTVAFGSPAKIIRSTTDNEIAGNIKNAALYVEEAAKNL